jgi:hypothetical protein
VLHVLGILATILIDATTMVSLPPHPKLVIATRLHLGNASAPPSTEKIRGWIQNIYTLVASVPELCSHAMIAVDATPSKTIPDYDYVQAIQEQVASVVSETNAGVNIGVLPITPWGKFVPALNALVYHAHSELQADQIIIVSAEVSVSATSIRALSEQCCTLRGDNDDKEDSSYVLVAGAALTGHVYHSSHDHEDEAARTSSTSKASTTTTTTKTCTSSKVRLNGRTCPWNTLAVWNVPKLVITGFLPVSDMGTTAGVEECAAIAVHQQLFPYSRAKLVKLDDVQWQDGFNDDEERRQWHQRKMNSKVERAAAQLKLLQLVDAATVEHC